MSLVLAALAVPTSFAVAGDPPAATDDPGLPAPPSFDLLRSLRYLCGQIQQQAAQIRAQVDQKAAALEEQAVADAQAGKDPAASSTAKSGANGMTGNVQKVADQAKASTDAAATTTPATATPTTAQPAAAPASNAGNDWKGMFDQLPDALQQKLKDFLNGGINNLLQQGLGQAQQSAQPTVDKLTKDYPGQQQIIVDAVNKAIAAGYGSAQSQLGATVNAAAAPTTPPAQK